MSGAGRVLERRVPNRCVRRRVHFHLIILSGDSTIGGMEEAARRIASYLAEDQNISTIYSRIPLYSDPEKRISFRTVGEEIGKFLEPLTLSGVPVSNGERARMESVVLRSQIEAVMRRERNLEHVIVSFYISGAGFLSQRIADALGLKHIACVRGSDFSKDCHSADRFQAAMYVAGHAFYIVTTNLAQEHWVRHILSRTRRVKTIYNSVPSEIFQYPLWSWQRRTSIKIFADCGLSHKKATQVLLAAIASISKGGANVRLALAGPIEPRQMEYWEGLMAKLNAAPTFKFAYLGQVSTKNLLRLLSDSDIYCSASPAEGCSNGAIKALVLGMPVVATRTGVLEDLANQASHVQLVSPGNAAALTEALARGVEQIRRGSIRPDQAWIRRWRSLLDVRKERKCWEQVVASVVSRRQEFSPARRSKGQK